MVALRMKQLRKATHIKEKGQWDKNIGTVIEVSNIRNIELATQPKATQCSEIPKRTKLPASWRSVYLCFGQDCSKISKSITLSFVTLPMGTTHTLQILPLHYKVLQPQIHSSCNTKTGLKSCP